MDWGLLIRSILRVRNRFSIVHAVPLLLSLVVSCGNDPESPRSQLHLRTTAPMVYSGSFPRFPHDTQARTLRDVMVLYTPDDIFSNITWKSIGYPDSGFFMIHNVCPKLKITLQTVPENRYLGEIPNRNIEKDPVAAQIWRDLFTKPEFRSWLEFGNHGYNHSPPGDPNLDHHEFNGNVNPAAYDSGFCYGTFDKVRNTYAAIGLDNDRIFVMRFPGYANTPLSLQALVDYGFLAFFDYFRSGRERLVSLPGNREILAIPSIHLWDIFDTEQLILEIRNGLVDSANLRASATYLASLDKAQGILDGLVQDGGIINLFDHWWEHSMYPINGIYYRFEFFKDVLSGLDRKYGNRIWWGFGSELALWSHMKRNATVSINPDDWGVTLAFGQPSVWKPGWAVTAGYTLSVKDSSDFPFPKNICYAVESEGYAQKHVLGEGDYWVEGNSLHFNFPFSGSLKIRVSLSEKDPQTFKAN